jgi:hypothetical protein
MIVGRPHAFLSADEERHTFPGFSLTIVNQSSNRSGSDAWPPHWDQMAERDHSHLDDISKPEIKLRPGLAFNLGFSRTGTPACAVLLSGMPDGAQPRVAVLPSTSPLPKRIIP